MKNIGLLWIAALLLAACTGNKKMSVRVTNDSSSDRSGELVEVAWADIAGRISPLDTGRLVVIDESGRQLPRQWVYEGKPDVQKLVFPATVRAGASSVYILTTGTPETFVPAVYGRLVPERKDDFAWENDKVAFRMYGPALQATGEISNGIDLWVKCTDSLVIDRWYENDLSGKASYHKNHGEGLDFYKVGRTLGLGAAAPFVNDTIWLGNNFVKSEVLDNGPLRVTFRLTYAPFEVDGQKVSETRTLSLDAGSHMNRVTEHFDMQADAMPLASGIVLRPEGGETKYSSAAGYAAYAEPETADGVIYAAVVSASPFDEVKEGCGHLLSISEYGKGSDYVYYTGGGWSKGGFAAVADWFGYVSAFASALRQPLTVTIVEY